MSESLNRPDARWCDPVGLILQATLRDFLRRKDLYVVALLMGIFLIGALAVRVIGVDSPDAAHFLVSAGLTLSGILAAILAAAFASRALPEEFERRTILPLLAKPLSRGQVIAGKLSAALGIAIPSYLAFVLVVMLSAPGIGHQSLISLIQVVALQIIAIAILAMGSMLLSLFWPTVLAALAALFWFFASDFVINTVLSIFKQKESPLWSAVGRLLYLLPNMGLLSHTELYASGSDPMALSSFLVLVLYGLVWVAALFALTNWLFNRKKF
ncbi:MAG: ABC transporter permease [Candidatus Sumerlaeia bacterium]